MDSKQDFNRQLDRDKEGRIRVKSTCIYCGISCLGSVEKTMGVAKAYLQLKAVTATKQIASAHAMLRTRAKVSAGNPPSSHANTAANKRNTEKKSLLCVPAKQLAFMTANRALNNDFGSRKRRGIHISWLHGVKTTHLRACWQHAWLLGYKIGDET
jgi:hypothetical protein